MKVISYFILAFGLICCRNSGEKSEISTGGYNYLLNSELYDSSFFALPIKDKISRRDSFLIYYYSPILYNAFDEKNLSIRPLSSSVFRMVYFDGALSSIRPLLIKLSETSIEVKEGLSGSFDGITDTNRLSKVEKFHYQILKYNYPLTDSSFSLVRRNYYDSLLVVYPELNDPNYYKLLLDKSTIYDQSFRYKTTKRSISKKKFNRFISLVNCSEFWTCQYDCNCRPEPMDAASYSLEANTKNKYQLINSAVCPNDSRRIVAVCDELLRLAGLDSIIQIRWIE